MASDRTRCRSAFANQVRTVPRTAACSLMLTLTLRDAIPKPPLLASAEFTTLWIRLLRIDARMTETATRVRVASAAAAPKQPCHHAAAW